MDGTILSQGLFQVPASGVVTQYIAVPSGTDWIWTWNFTQATLVGGATPNSIENYWQIGMPVGSSYLKYYTTGTTAINGDIIATGGISVYDPSGTNPYSLPLVGNPVATTAISNATRPVVLTANTAGIVVGSVVRMSRTLQTDTSGIDFVVGAVTPNTSITLLAASNALANVPGAVGGAGFYRKINVDSPWYPARRFITNITRVGAAVVSTSVVNSFVVGQVVRFTIPAESGMTQLDGLAATIIGIVDSFNFIINVNTTGFTAFTFPTVAQQPSSFPIVVPVGEDTSRALLIGGNQTPIGPNGLFINGTQSGILSDATTNTAFLGIVLGTGALGVASGAATTGPAGTAALDFVFWRAGKSSFGGQ